MHTAPDAKPLVKSLQAECVFTIVLTVFFNNVVVNLLFQQLCRVVAKHVIASETSHSSFQDLHLASTVDACWTLMIISFIQPYTTCSMKKPVSVILRNFIYWGFLHILNYDLCEYILAGSVYAPKNLGHFFGISCAAEALKYLLVASA